MGSTETSWRARPVATVLVKAAILLAPVALGTAAGLLLAHAVPPPAGTAARVAWSVLVLGTSTLVLLGAERVMRRLAPLTLLMRLSLVFPDQAPKRFGVAMKAIRPSRRSSEGLEAKDCLALLASLLAHDRRTRGHSERVAAYTTMIAEELGIEGEEHSRLVWGALLHDIGKLEVPASILNKPGALDDGEWKVMSAHPEHGRALVEPLRPWLGDALSAVDGHHERYDGNGYPDRRRSVDLPQAARIVAVADAFEVMTAARSYKKPMSIAAARQEVVACTGGQFDPEVSRAFLTLSVPKLWRVAGPMAWVAQLPVLGVLVRGELVPVAVGAAAQNAALATTQAVTAAAVVGGALVATGATSLLTTDPAEARPAAVVVGEEPEARGATAASWAGEVAPTDPDDGAEPANDDGAGPDRPGAPGTPPPARPAPETEPSAGPGPVAEVPDPVAPGHDDEVPPGHGGENPGHDDEVPPGHGGENPGHDDEVPPGHGGENPGHGGENPGHGGGNGGGNSGHGGDNSGHGGENSGHGHDHGQGQGQGGG